MLELVHIGKKFSSQTALQEVSLQIPDGEFLSLLGPSGCGKTTLLRILAGLERASEGQILLDGRRVDGLPPQQRPFNMVFQRHALFPHLSVAENIAYGLRIKKHSATEIADKVQGALKLVALQEFADRKPETLSGGQSQRVALARALVNEPRVLLLDEPLSALDQKMREHMQRELRSLQRQLGVTFIYVTHDQEEALAMSDRIAIMAQGRLQRVCEPRELYASEDEFTKNFIGSSSCFRGTLVALENDFAVLRLADGRLLRGRVGNAESLQLGLELEAFVQHGKIQIFHGASS